LAQEKNFLQAIKLEISRTFKLVPYERLAFHRILGIFKSEAGRNILLKELTRGPEIRKSAISRLTYFDIPEVLDALIPYLTQNITSQEKIHILLMAERVAGDNHIDSLTGFISHQKDVQGDDISVLSKAFDVLQKIGRGSDDVLNFLLTIVKSDDTDNFVKSRAVEALASFRVVSLFEELLNTGIDELCRAVYRALYRLGVELAEDTEKKEKEKTADKDQTGLYTYSPDSEDKLVLDIRVLLGKMTTRFDSYSSPTKISFISAMIACNHREFLIYTMKALTSNDSDLVYMVLYCLHDNIERIKDPDKLFRNLIALSMEFKRDNELIIEIFNRYFSRPVNNRNFNILKDKLYSYIVVTLETYFETFRKDFMITDVMEKSYPESFQKLRKFMLEKFSPAVKKRVLNFLNHETPSMISHLLTDIEKVITSVDDSDREDLAILVEVLYEGDEKSRANSASRIEDLNYEKRYLRNRIIRLCEVISRLQITDAASALVNIYNYLKKYHDEYIFDAVVRSLSILNYSYMLGEIEVLLASPDGTDQMNALELLSLFTEQRSLNILLEFIQNRVSEESGFVPAAINVLLERDITGNVTACQIFKKIIEINRNREIQRLAILGIGKSGMESDIDYLNGLFSSLGDADAKDSVVRSINEIMSSHSGYNRRILIKNLTEYLKDPGIRVRIYSCLLLAHLGNADALRSIRDMLVIKNKSIQRDILTILGDLKSLEFSFFLLSLLKDEYGITGDIVPVIELLPDEELKEIDAFVVNIFRKFEAPDLDIIDTGKKRDKEVISVGGIEESEVTLLNIEIYKADFSLLSRKVPELISMNIVIKGYVLNRILDNNGIIARISNNRVVAYFRDTEAAAAAAMGISSGIDEFNLTRTSGRHLRSYIQILTENVTLLNDELIDFPEYKLVDMKVLPPSNRVIVNRTAMERIENGYQIMNIPDLTFYKTGFSYDYYEIITSVNFTRVTEKLINEIVNEDDRKQKLAAELEQELAKLKKGKRTRSSVAIASELDNIGNLLKTQLDDIERYVNRRSTDRELNKNVRKMLINIHNLYKVEISRLIIE